MAATTHVTMKEREPAKSAQGPRARARKPSARTRRAAAGCAVFTTVVLGAVALVWSSCFIPDASANVQRQRSQQRTAVSPFTR